MRCRIFTRPPFRGSCLSGGFSLVGLLSWIACTAALTLFQPSDYLANNALKRQHQMSADNQRLFLRKHRHFFGPFFNQPNDYSTRYAACDWLHQQAIATGSAYWWRRYQDCLAQNG
jgi:hypothetical protein